MLIVFGIIEFLLMLRKLIVIILYNSYNNVLTFLTTVICRYTICITYFYENTHPIEALLDDRCPWKTKWSTNHITNRGLYALGRSPETFGAWTVLSSLRDGSETIFEFCRYIIRTNGLMKIRQIILLLE